MPPAVPRDILLVYGGQFVDSISAGDGKYTMIKTPPAWVRVGIQLNVYEAANAANNGTFRITGVAGLVITTDNTSSVLETAGSTARLGFPIGGTSDFQIDGKIRFRKDYESSTIEFDAVFGDPDVTSNSDLELYSNALEEAFRVIRERLRVTISSSSTPLIDLNPETKVGGNTGFNQIPSATKSAGPWDTGRSRKYVIGVVTEVPADLVTQSGRRTSSVELNLEPGRRGIITLSGKYTALGALTARAAYDAAIAGYIASITAGFGGTWEKISERTTGDDTTKNLDFTVVLEEKIYADTPSSLDDARIVQARVSYSRERPAPGDTTGTGARRLVQINCNYEAWVDKTLTVDMTALWTNTIRPYLINETKRLFSPGGLALIDDRFIPEKTTNRITANLIFMIVDSDGGTLLEHTRATEIDNDEGILPVPVWTGDPHAKHLFQGPKRRTRTTTIIDKVAAAVGGGGGAGALQLGIGAGGGGGVGFGFQGAGLAVPIFQPASAAAVNNLVAQALGEGEVAAPVAGAGVDQNADGFTVLSTRTVTVPKTLGLPPDTLDITETTTVIVELFSTPPPVGRAPVPSGVPAAGNNQGGQ